MHKIYAFNNGGSPGFMSAVAIGDDGRVLAGHCCSSEGYMPHDLGVTGNWKHENYNKHFGEGNWEIEWVPTAELDTHEGLNAAFAKNESLAKPDDGLSEHATMPMIEVEFSE